MRPTDFEWAWLSDMLHHRMGAPSEYKLSANLRSPRRIAELVNRVWDLYSLIEKQERPRGAGQAEIEDDATDQILYCTATPGAELDELAEIAGRPRGTRPDHLGGDDARVHPGIRAARSVDRFRGEGSRFSHRVRA